VGLKARPGVQRDPRREPAFERFVAESSTWLLRSAYLLTGERGAAEDLLQLTLLHTVSRWRSAQRAPEAYARRVLVNLVRDRQRRAARRVVERLLEEAIGAGLSRDHADAIVGRDELFDAVARLPREQREVVVLRFWADLSVAETAAATGTSEGTVKSRTSRALAHMRELLTGPLTTSTQPAPVEVADDD
jgi:RNA polymerase sigma-70 factor (sigma-E family)